MTKPGRSRRVWRDIPFVTPHRGIFSVVPGRGGERRGPAGIFTKFISGDFIIFHSRCREGKIFPLIATSLYTYADGDER